MIRTHFNALPQASRERLAAALTGTPPRGALACTPVIDTGELRKLGWFGVILVAIFTYFLFTMSIGNVRRDDALLGATGSLTFTAVLFICTWWLLSSVHRRMTRVDFPAPPGTYLLPLDIVVFTGPVLSIHPLQAMQGSRATDFYTSGRYQYTLLAITLPTGVFSFRVSQQQSADIQRSLAEYDQRFREAIARDDRRTLHELDPLYDARSSPMWPPPPQGRDATPPSPTSGPLVVDRRAPSWLKRPVIVAAVFALVAAPAVCFARNYYSDEEMFESLRGRPMEDLCQRYIALEGRHVAEVRSTLLPAAVFSATPRSSAVAYREFIRRFPQSPLVRDARVRVHELFGEARTNWRRQAATGNPELVPFMTRLLAWEEAHDSPKVRVRFFPPASTSLALIDRLAAQNPLLLAGHTVAPIAPHFTDAAMRPREGRVVTALSTAFRTVFQEGLLSLEDGGRLSEDAPTPNDAPVFDVSYLVAPSGAEYHIDSMPTRVFIGMTFTFRVTMRIPDGGAPYSFTTFASPDRHFTFRRRTGVAPTDAFIYGVMSDNAFDRLSRSFRAVFFQPTQADIIAERNAAAEAAADDPTTQGTPTTPATQPGEDDDATSGQRPRRHRRHH